MGIITNLGQFKRIDRLSGATSLRNKLHRRKLGDRSIAKKINEAAIKMKEI